MNAALDRERLRRVADAGRLLWAVLAVCHMAFIYWSSDRVWEGQASDLPSGVTNFVHFPLYGVLAGFLWLALRGYRAAGINCDRWVWVLTATFGLLDEWHQSWVPGRDFSLWDVLTDASGAGFATSVLVVLMKDDRRLAVGTIFAALAVGLAASFIFPALLPNL